jgi:hypothetical protein
VRTLIAMFFALLFPIVVSCQDTISAEETIRRIINTGLIEGHDQKVIGGMGDGAAVIVTRVVGERKLSASQIDRILLVLKSAFGDISATPDPEPRATLFVLQMLELSAKDAGLRARVAEAKQYIQESFIKWKKMTKNNCSAT